MSGSAQLPEALASASAGSQALLQRLGGMVAAEVLESAEPPATPSLALLGETNRGKSSLVNALLAMRHCSPVAADAATATSLVFGYAERGCTTARYTDGRRDHSVRPSELAELVTVVAGAVQRRLPPHHVEVLLPNPLTRRLTLVDTPGVGGLHSRHGELAGHAAAEATAALFVVDASAPLTAGELDFLTEVAERIETVVFALTKIDAFRGAQQVLEADRALVASRLPGFADAPWFAVSARLHELAEQATDATAAQLLRERSGIGELRTWLQELLLGRAKMLSEANALRAVDTALAGCRVDLASAGRACSAGDAERAALRARRDELSS
ncbi:MAG: dynamin family protein, partial [Sciscionella sp.]